jgi:hypothetical protein
MNTPGNTPNPTEETVPSRPSAESLYPAPPAVSRPPVGYTDPADTLGVAKHYGGGLGITPLSVDAGAPLATGHVEPPRSQPRPSSPYLGRG